MASGDLFYLAFLFGVWLAVMASVVYASAQREAGGKQTPLALTLRRRTLAIGGGLVAAYFSVALPALLLVPDGYSITVAAFAVACAIQSAHFWLSLVRARRLRLAGQHLATAEVTS